MLPLALDAQLGTPYPRSAGFDTDIGAFIESSSVSSLQGLMAPSINNNVVQGETFLPGQIFVFGGFALRANSLGHLEQIDSYAPGHQVRFGNLNHTPNIRGDSIFNGFGHALGAADSHDEHGLGLLSDNPRDIAPAGAPDLKLEQIASPEDGWMDPAQRPHTHRW